MDDLHRAADYSPSAALTYEPLKRGLTQVFTGGGKGKTSAGIGTAVRASGRGYRVYIVYFMNRAYDSGEQEVLHRLPGSSGRLSAPASCAIQNRLHRKSRKRLVKPWPRRGGPCFRVTGTL